MDGTSFSRRGFLQMVGAVGGAAAVYQSMVALGMLRTPQAWAGPPKLGTDRGRGQKVLILGAGVGGMTAAYLLKRAGYEVKVLEALDRVGGRSLTARSGSVITEKSAAGVTTQKSRLDPGQYINMGPGRLPYHHRRVLHYCAELGVPLEIYVMETMANLFQSQRFNNGQPMVRRRVANDTRGYISELLAKAIDKKALDAELSATDRERLLDLLRVFGELDDSGRYKASTRDGCLEEPLDVHTACLPNEPGHFSQLLKGNFWAQRFYQPLEYEWQPTLFQPVGGMDQIAKGLARALGPAVALKAPVQAIHPDDTGVTVVWSQGGKTIKERADHCISNIPVPVLRTFDVKWEPTFQKAIDTVRFDGACKVGWQAERRFWEDGQNQIYGGISYIDHMITQIWYPSNGYFGQKGTLTGAYIYGDSFQPPSKDPAIQFGNMSLSRRLQVAREGGMRLHPEIGDDRIVPLKKALSIAWQNVPYQAGGWVNWNSTDSTHMPAYARLLAPDRRFHVVGDQVSVLPGWQEGAMMSAEHVVEQIAGLRARTVPTLSRIPHTRRLVEGLR